MFRWLPWKFFVKHAARRYGVLDPANFLARIRRFAQPSEVAEPLELLRAGIVFHARGLVNTKAIQHNLDWVWPYWVERQFNPDDPSFVPRAFSFSHINLTHRNWTAVGRPGVAVYPIVDPRGLVTPLHDGWSLDFWIVGDSGQSLLPSQLDDHAISQQLLLEPELVVLTHGEIQGKRIELATRMSPSATCISDIAARSEEDGWLVVAIRPYNPEGIQFIQELAFHSTTRSFRVNHEASVRFSDSPDALRLAHYAEGDVGLDLPGSDPRQEIHCEVGMATGAALFRLRAGTTRELAVEVPLNRDLRSLRPPADPALSWDEALLGQARLDLPDARMKFLYDAALRSLLLLSADELVPGPYTYRRFWFRDACLMLHPMLLCGQLDRATRILSTFPRRQTFAGYFLSQEGEWDSNGQVLWIAARHAELSGEMPGLEMQQSLKKAVRWLAKKRLPSTGLLPAGFSAEHLGPNDFYYWDNYWALAGLRAMSRLWQADGDPFADEAQKLAADFAESIRKSIDTIPPARSRGAIPAAPGRRMDAGAIGSMVADYPLQITAPGDSKVMKTAGFLLDHCCHQGGFFQEMIHSGINAYLTLDLAQTFLRAGDPRFARLIRRVAELASPTGQWPEAIHPRTLGGCMGDGQHGWAAAEWIMMMRNCFVREEDDELVLGSGVLPEWLAKGGEPAFGPTLTRWGRVSVRLNSERLHLDATWRGAAPRVRVALPGHLSILATPGQREFPLLPI